MNPTRRLGWLIPSREREFVLGDLQELYGHRPGRLAWEIIRVGIALRLHRSPPLAAPRFPLTPRTTFMDHLRSDLRFGLRQIATRPGFTALAVLTLALGIGASTAIFSVVNPILFESLPYPDPDRVVQVGERGSDGSPSRTGYATFVDVRSMSTSFAALAVNSSWQPTLQEKGEPERLNGQRVTRDFFAVFGVPPALGRDFTAEEHVRGQHRVTILSHGLWQRRFGGDPSVIGRAVTFDGIQYVVVGVMARTFENLISPSAQLWAPLAYEASLPWACRTCRHLAANGRLKPGIPPEAARRELDVISGRLMAEYPTQYATAGMVVAPLQEVLTRSVKPALLAVLGAVGFVLLIACANVSSLLLGRALQRETEFAIRGALGARPGRVVRQLLTESVMLGLAGGAAGVAIAWLGIEGLKSIAPASLPRLDAIGIDGSVLGFAVLVSLLTGLLFGVVPAFATARPDLFAALRPGGRHTGSRSRKHARAVLVGGEVALAVMLLVGAGLLLRSLEKLLAVNPGFDPKHLLTMTVQTTGPRYSEDEPVWAFWDRTLDAVRGVPGVERAAWTSMLPLGGNFDRYGVQIEGKLLSNPEDAASADRYSVTPDYVQTMGIPVKRGRPFTAQDTKGSPHVVLINETFARIGWGGEDPIGKKVQFGGRDRPWRTVVGIVGDVHHTGLDQERAPQLYIPESQGHFADGGMDLAVRTRGDPAALAAAVQAAIRSVDPTQPILNVSTMEQVISGTAQQRRFTFILFQVFAAVALLLAAAGIYGVLAGNVTERTREIGIRSALGASRSELLGLVLRQGLTLAVAGVVVGSAASLLLARFLERLLYGVRPQDPVTFAAVVIVLLAVAVGASWGPAWRATRVSPLEAIRGE
jgi:putative ABC transport system permease protein